MKLFTTVSTIAMLLCAAPLNARVLGDDPLDGCAPTSPQGWLVVTRCLPIATPSPHSGDGHRVQWQDDYQVPPRGPAPVQPQQPHRRGVCTAASLSGSRGRHHPGLRHADPKRDPGAPVWRDKYTTNVYITIIHHRSFALQTAMPSATMWTWMAAAASGSNTSSRCRC